MSSSCARPSEGWCSETACHGSSATVAAVTYQRRAAYDAPRWVRTDRPVKIGELLDDPRAAGARRRAAADDGEPASAADLFTGQVGVPVELSIATRHRRRGTIPSDGFDQQPAIALLSTAAGIEARASVALCRCCRMKVRGEARAC